MALTRKVIVETAMEILREYGLADLSMRRLARDLGVQPGALYWHVKNKQELLTVLAGLILAPVSRHQPATARELAVHIRTALLTVRDGAEVVALAHALEPDSAKPLLGFSVLLARAGLPAPQADSAGRALVHYILGSVMEEQTRIGLIRAGLLSPADGGGAATPSGGSLRAGTGAKAVFLFGLDLFLAGASGQFALAGNLAPAPSPAPPSSLDPSPNPV